MTENIAHFSDITWESLQLKSLATQQIFQHLSDQKNHGSWFHITILLAPVWENPLFISRSSPPSIHMIVSQLSGHCDVISNQLWCHQQNENCEWDMGTMCKDRLFVVIYGFIISCKKWNNVCTLATNCFCKKSICNHIRLLGKHQICSVLCIYKKYNQCRMVILKVEHITWFTLKRDPYGNGWPSYDDTTNCYRI